MSHYHGDQACDPSEAAAIEQFRQEARDMEALTALADALRVIPPAESYEQWQEQTDRTYESDAATINDALTQRGFRIEPIHDALTRDQETGIIVRGLRDRQAGESDEELAGRIIDDFARSQPKYRGDNPLRLTVEPDGSISQIAGGPLDEPVDTGPTDRG